MLQYASAFLKMKSGSVYLSFGSALLKIVGSLFALVSLAANKACPKDAFPLPNVDKLVDNSSNFCILSFMDTCSGYNQIPMYPIDQENTVFMIDKGNYCYRCSVFELKNVGETYPRMTNRVFKSQIGWVCTWTHDC